MMIPFPNKREGSADLSSCRQCFPVCRVLIFLYPVLIRASNLNKTTAHPRTLYVSCNIKTGKDRKEACLWIEKVACILNKVSVF